MTSWKNPDARDCEVGLDNYHRGGVMAALNVVSAVLPEREAHLCGCRLRGTILSVAAATMARGHIAPRRSAYKTRPFATTVVSFVFASGGYNGGIANPPDQAKGFSQLLTGRHNDRYMDTLITPGSWWLTLEEWLVPKGACKQAAPPRIGTADRDFPPICVAAGQYVRERSPQI